MNRWETGRNWTRKSIEELIDEYVKTHDIGGGGENPDDPTTRSKYNFPTIAFYLTTQRGKCWVFLVGQNKTYTTNNYNRKQINLYTDGLKLPTNDGSLPPLTIDGPQDLPVQVTEYSDFVANHFLMTMTPETLTHSGFAKQDGDRIMAGCPKMLYSRWALDGHGVYSAWQVVGNTVYMYKWVKGPDDVDDTYMNISPATWCSWGAQETAGSASNAFRATAKIEWTAISLFSSTFHSQAEKLYNAISKNSTTDSEIIVSTFRLTKDDLQKIYPDYTITEIEYNNDTTI